MNQVSIEEVIQMINANIDLDHDFKIGLGTALIEYISNDRTINLSNFKSSFERLSVTSKQSIMEHVESYSYQPVTGKMVINESYLSDEGINKENIYMQMALDLLYSNDKITGFDNGSLTALNKGFRETIAKNLVGEEKIEGTVSDEYIYTQLIGRIIGSDTLMEAYQTNNPELLKAKLEQFNLTKVNELAEYNVFRNQSPDRMSELARIQIQLYHICETNNINVNDMVNNMVFSSRIFEDGKHKNIDNMNKIIQLKVYNGTENYKVNSI